MRTRRSRPAAALVLAVLLPLGAACAGGGGDDAAEPTTTDGRAGTAPSSTGTTAAPVDGASDPPVTGGTATGESGGEDEGGAWPIDPTLVGVVRTSTARRYPELMATVDDAALTTAITVACGHARAAVAAQSSVEEATAAILADLPSDPTGPDLRAAMLHAVHRFFLAGGCGDELSPLTAALLEAS